MDRSSGCVEDPRAKSNRYSNRNRTKFDPDQWEFEPLQFLIDDHYVGQPPRVQVSIDNLNDNINEEFLKKELTKLGKTRSLEIIRHPTTRAHLGMAKIQFEKVSAARNCVETWNNRQLMGRQLSVFEDPRFARIERVKDEKLNPRPAPLPVQTISTSLSSFSAFSTPIISTPEPSSRPRLDDRIASLMKHPDSLLSSIVAQPQMPPTLCDYSNINYYNDSRRPEINHLGSINHHPNHNKPYHKYDHNETIKSEEYHESVDNNDDDWNPKPPEVVKVAFDIKITSSQAHKEILPYSFTEFTFEMFRNLRETISRRLVEKSGYPILAHYQNNDRAIRDEKRLKHDAEMTKKEREKRYERLYMSKNRVRPQPPSVPNMFTQFRRARDTQSHQAENKRPQMPQRINRSAAIEPERRGSHNTCDSDSSSSPSSPGRSESDSESESDSGSESDDNISSSSGSGSDSDSSSSSKSSGSSSSFSASSTRSRRSSIMSTGSVVRRRGRQPSFKTVSPAIVDVESKPVALEDHNEAASALMLLRGAPDSNSHDAIKKPEKSAGTKRKKKVHEKLSSVASEYRAAKRFASDSGNTFGSLNENIENAMIDDDKLPKDSSEVEFPGRLDVEKKRMLSYEFQLATLEEEDLKFLEEVHNQEGLNAKNDQGIEVPFGSAHANKVHLSMKRDLIEPGVAKSMGQPKWWTGCSRCSLIPRDQRDKPTEDEEIDYADLTMAPFKSHVIQAATTNSSRRDHRGDQRRIAASNPEISEELLRSIVSNTLKVKN